MLPWLLAILGVGLLVILLLSFMAEEPSSDPAGFADIPDGRVAYLSFGAAADTLWLADPVDPSKREALYDIAHAREYGIVPSVSPSGSRFAYTSLDPGLTAPTADSPAILWVGDLASGPIPQLLATDVDLLVEPVWTPDGNSLVYRRSSPQEQSLAIIGVDGGAERIVASSQTSSLFPVGFVPAGDLLYYVSVSQNDGSKLFVANLVTGAMEEVVQLSGGLTRDWALSPDARQIAFLEISFTGSESTSRASVLDVERRDIDPVTLNGSVAFGPVWSDDGRLAIGAFDPYSGEAKLLTRDASGEQTETAGTEKGFDVPLALLPRDAGYVARSFENDSITAPGRSTLTLVGADGERRTIATGEVTFVGWTNP